MRERGWCEAGVTDHRCEDSGRTSGPGGSAGCRAGARMPMEASRRIVSAGVGSDE